MPTFALIRRGFLSLLVAVSLTLAPGSAPLQAQTSGANSKYAAIVVDAETGEVLFSRFAEERRFPASITKVMTLYLAFEALTEGRAKLDDVITVSPHAAGMAPSKLGLAAGERITLDDAMHATAIRSANDMAVAIAEHLAGSEGAFADKMTQTARRLGMTQTRYVNANGLPDSRQITSARDLSILARAVMRDYPQWYRYFGFHDWDYRGRHYRNTNGLLLTARGYDGMKTGYTNASGYNLAASAVRDGRRLITIVLGGRTTASRNAHVAELMETGFDLERARRSGQRIEIAQNFFEQRGFGISAEPNEPVAYASASSDDEDGEGTPYAVAALTPAPAPVPSPAPPPPARSTADIVRASTATPARPVERAEAGGDLTASLNGAPGSRRAAPPARPRATPVREAAGRWAVQVGAFREEQVARDWLTEVNRRFRTQFASAERTVQDASGWYRSRFTGMTESAAQAACSVLAERRVTCMVIRPE